MKQKKKCSSLSDILLAISVLGTIIYFICIVLQFMGVYSLGFCGFGLDSSGLLYIGRDHKIEVWEDNRLVRVIAEDYLGRGYAFTLLHNDTIKLSTASDVLILDLSGKEIIEEYEDKGTTTYQELNRNKHLFTDRKGNQYTAISFLGILQIRQNGRSVFSSSLVENALSIMWLLGFPSFFLMCYLSANQHKSIIV